MGVQRQAMNRIFFYGLFMDAQLLRAQGYHPTLVGPAELPGFQIRIGERASLIPSPGATSFGMLMDLTDEEATGLYSAPDVRDYHPQEVHAMLLDDRSSHACLCYNLPAGKLGAGTNPGYAERLAALVLGLGFPAAYASEIASQGEP